MTTAALPVALLVRLVIPGLLALLLALPVPTLEGQVVPGPDGAPDPTPVDTIPLPPEPPEGEVVVVRNPPIRPEPVPDGWSTGVWEWDREALQSTRALTLSELLEEIPGIVTLRGGDIGQPVAATAFGLGGGRIRVFLDGVELPPLEGSVVDLSRVGIGGADRVRVQRRPGELRIDLSALRLFEPRPYTLLEVGTGDLNTNLFRGTFAHPDALGGNVVVSLDRVDTEGPFRDQPGASFGAQIRHNLFRGQSTALSWEFRTMSSRRPEQLWSPQNISRSDLALHLRRELAPGLLVGASWQRSWLGTDYGRGVTPPERPEVNEDPRSQLAARVSLDRPGWWGEVAGRVGGGRGWPSWALDLQTGGRLEGWGGASFSVDHQAWDPGGGANGVHLRVWTEPRLGLSLFGEFDQGRRGVPFRLLPEEVDPAPDLAGTPSILSIDSPSRQENGSEEEDPTDLSPSFTDRSGVRAGVDFRWSDLHLGAALLRTSADSLHPVGFAPDLEGIVTTGPARSGVEAAATLPLGRILSGLRLTGTVQHWDEATPWRYLPRRSYEARTVFHDVFLESGNLEVWGDVGVRGRDGMTLPLPDASGAGELLTVGSLQSWFARVQVRVVTVRIFVLWENFTLRQRNEDFPDRRLPPTRVLYGVRWTLWN